MRKAVSIMLDHTRTKWEVVAYFHSKLALVVWGVVYLMWPPTIVVRELGYVLINASASFAIFGGLLGIAGLFVSNSNNLNRRYQGLIMEFSGLLISIGGPLGLFFTSANLTLKFNNPDFHTVTGICYALSAFMISRIFTVWRSLKAAS